MNSIKGLILFFPPVLWSGIINVVNKNKTCTDIKKVAIIKFLCWGEKPSLYSFGCLVYFP